MLIDNHLHLEDRKNRKFFLPEDYSEAAAKQGIEMAGFSDHAYIFEEAREINFNDWQNERRLFSLSEYASLISEFKSRGGKAFFGLEVDYSPRKEKQISDFLAVTEKKHQPDFFIGSVHWLGEWGFDLDEKEFWEVAGRRGEKEVLAEYFENVGFLIESGLFDVVGHIDIIKLFGLKLKNKRHILEIVDLLARKDQVIEINTNGKNKPVGEFYPGEEFLREAFSKGVDITFGSDAHSFNRVGENFSEAVATAKRIGWERAVYFEKREKKYIKI